MCIFGIFAAPFVTGGSIAETLARFPARPIRLADKEPRHFNMVEHVPTAKPASTFAGHALTPTLGEHVATLRLIAKPGLSAGRYEAGVDIIMTPGSHTYWKQPGEAGIPPVFAFNGSDNVAEAQVAFPAPSRISEDGIEAFGYTDKVVFPVAVTPADPAKPAVLKVDVTYAVCNKICVPMHSTGTLALTPDGAGSDGAKVAAALAAVPVAASDANLRDLSITPDQSAEKPSWTLVWSGATPVEDVFAVAPEGFYFETKKLGPDRFLLRAAQVVVTSKTNPVSVALTLSRKEGSLVVMEKLDVGMATR